MADPDDILSSLGGSLMQDLLKDISTLDHTIVDDNNNNNNNNDDDDYATNPAMLSTLAMLERELDHPGPMEDHILPNASTTAASWIIPTPAAPATNTAPPATATATATGSDGMDAWALSLNKFSTLNLEHDFIQADLDNKRRREETTTTTTTATATATTGTTKFEDYNIMSSPTPGIPPPPGVVLPPTAPPIIPTPPSSAAVAVMPSPPPTNTTNTTTAIMASPPPHSAVMASPPPGVPPPGAAVIMASTPFIPPPRKEFLFDNPNPKAAPIQAKPTSCMKSKDILTVVHASLRPLYAMMHNNASLSYHADFYHLQYTMSTPPTAPTNNNNNNNNNQNNNNKQNNQNNTASATNEFEQISLREKKFIVTTEKRAMDWSQKQQTLGQVVKTNVYRPRALLSSTTVLRKEESKEDDNNQRTNLWKARLLVDRGYSAMLELIELRNILFSKDDEALRQQYLPHVQKHISTLHKTFGVTEKNKQVKTSIVSLTLSLSKGRVLLARLINLGIFPHESARYLLPHVCQIIFSSPAKNEDYNRLIPSLIGFINTVHPSLQREELLDSLKRIDNQTNNFHHSSRSQMELFHSLLTRSQQICSPQDMEWKTLERNIFTKLSTPLSSSS